MKCSSHYSAKQTVSDEASIRDKPARVRIVRSTGSSGMWSRKDKDI
jgi:hypothetical protein